MEPPADLVWAYTRCGIISTSSMVIDDSGVGGRGTWYTHDANDILRRVASAERELAHPNPVVAASGRVSWANVLRALRTPVVTSAVRGGTCVVFGSSSPAVEALLLAAGAARVLTVEYNNVTYEHPRLTTARPDEVRAAWARAPGARADIPHRGVFDVALSVSSFDHDGLGRYGDPLAPDGDLVAMDAMAEYLKPAGSGGVGSSSGSGSHGGGLALVSVPVGPDHVLWNAMRRYGRVRLPLLLAGWRTLERAGWLEGRMDVPTGPPRGPSHEPMFVLQRLPAEALEAGAGVETVGAPSVSTTKAAVPQPRAAALADALPPLEGAGETAPFSDGAASRAGGGSALDEARELAAAAAAATAQRSRHRGRGVEL